MTESQLRYCVLRAESGDAKIQQISAVLSAFHKIPLQDAARQARNAWGFMAEDIDKESADGLAAKLKEAGIECLVVPLSLIEEKTVPELVTSLEFLPNGFQVHCKMGHNELLLKDQLRVLASAGFKQTTTTTVKVKEGPTPTQRAVSMGLLMAGLPIRIGGKAKEVEKKKQTTELYFYLDLCFRNPVRRFRVDGQDFNFACLKARMGYTAPQNFRILVMEMIRLCPQAMKNRGSTVLFDDAPVASMGYDAITDLDRECRWLLTLDALKNP